MSVPNGARLAAAGEAGATPADRWRAALAAAAVPPAALPEGRLALIAPHPDDEVLGLGATLARRARARAGAADRDAVICVSDGAASHPGAIDPAALRRRRAAEAAAGAADLGVALRRLDLPDGGLDAAAVAAALGPELDSLRPAAVAVTWLGDGHPDHHACAAAAARWAGAAGVPLLSFPVWMWHWARPGDPAVPWDRLRRLDAAAGDFAVKRRALGRHRSQLTAPEGLAGPIILPPPVVDRFFLGAEYVIVDGARG